jgi:hypothetical protein
VKWINYAILVCVCAIVLTALAWLMDPRHLVESAAPIAAAVAMSFGDVYLPGRRPFRLLWGACISCLAFAVVLGYDTAQVAQFDSSIVFGMTVCTISALLGGFCFRCLVTRWRAERTTPREAQPPIESNGAQA